VGRSIVVPYDASPAAHAALRRAAAVAAAHQYSRLLIAAVGLDPAALDDPVAEAIEITRSGLPVEVHWLSPVDPVGALRRLLTASDTTLAVPLGGRGRAAWYTPACRTTDGAARTMIFFLAPHELRAAVTPPDRARARALPDALRWALAWLVPGHPQPRVYQQAKDRP
jgi:hypothetical protein